MVGALSRYWELLSQWREAVNLTGCRTAADFARTFVREPLTPLREGLRLPERGRTLDVGSGAGNPGLALAIVHPEREFLLLEARQRRAAFLRHVVGALELHHVRVFCDRAENLGRMAGWRERFPLVLSRAVAPASRACELCLPFAGIDGRVWLYLSAEDARRVQAAGGLLVPLGVETIQVAGHAAAGRGTGMCVVLTKTRPANPIYPRSNAQASRVPLFGGG